MEQEIWKTTERLKGFYEVSNLGRIRRIAPAKGTTAGRILTVITHPNTGYKQIRLSIRNHADTFAMHRLVCEAFHGPPSTGQEAHHKNSDKTCNHEDNLEWVTKSGNLIAGYRLRERVSPSLTSGRKISEAQKHRFKEHPEKKPVGSANGMAKLSEEKVKRIVEDLHNGESGANLARKYGISQALISNIKTGKRWHNVA